MNTTPTRLALADITATLITRFDLPALLERIAGTALTGFDAHIAVISLLDGDALHAVATASVGSAAADERLFTSGPVRTSARETAVAMIGDASAAGSSRWEQYRALAEESGVGAVRAYPVVALGVGLGALAVYTAEPWGTQRPDELGQMLADLTALALTTGASEIRRVDASAAVQALLSGAATISGATGVLAEFFDDSTSAARTRLSRLARAHGTTDSEHAAAIIAAQNVAPADIGSSELIYLPTSPVPPRRFDS
ncbi:GAF domain-containing protein [Rhodococcus sp. NBC_00297]|uniref:GAF domain-containing protein n=1 Tax=Rhodococcus sp. NBC_00297 TaxID=2976005 RepID=UPI002E283256|nr:GAF domain-containing protein [Rhodococcus sp. NBC_00297]